MILLQLSTGKTEKLDPRVEEDLYHLDNLHSYKKIRRVSLLDNKGKRVDLPMVKNNVDRMWLELVKKFDEIRGERFCMITMHMLMRITLYYSDSRVVFDIDQSGGYINDRT